MTRRTRWLAGLGLAGLGLAATVAGVAVWQNSATSPAPETSVPARNTGSTPAGTADGAAVQAKPTLYCEFTNFADQNPRVGFYFAAEPGDRPSAYGLIFQRERDGTQEEYGGDRARPRWALDTTENPAVLRAPDDSIAINLYGYDPHRSGTTWFEAGLRSIRYLNLGGRCRLTT